MSSDINIDVWTEGDKVGLCVGKVTTDFRESNYRNVYEKLEKIRDEIGEPYEANSPLAALHRDNPFTLWHDPEDKGVLVVEGFSFDEDGYETTNIEVISDVEVVDKLMGTMRSVMRDKYPLVGMDFGDFGSEEQDMYYGILEGEGANINDYDNFY